MATKKQKHAEALAKRQKFMATLQADNEKALQKARDKREREEWEAWRENHDKRHVHDNGEFSEHLAVKECPLCKKKVGLSRRTLSPGVTINHVAVKPKVQQIHKLAKTLQSK